MSGGEVSTKKKPLKNGNWMQTVAVLALLVLLIVFIRMAFNPTILPGPPGPPNGNFGHYKLSLPTPKQDDWLINETVVLNNISENIPKNIFIMANGTFIIKHSKLFLKEALVVYSGGNFIVINSLFSTYENVPGYSIYADTGAKVLIKNSTIVNSNNLVIASSNVSIIKTSFRHSNWGIIFQGAQNSLVANNTFYDIFSQGVLLRYSHDIKLENNLFNACIYGMVVSDSKNIDIRNNKYYNVSLGIELINSVECSVIGNQLYNTILMVSGENRTTFDHNVRENTVNDFPLMYIFNQTDVTISSLNLGQLILAYSSHIEVRNVTIKSTFIGVSLTKCSTITIHNSKFEGNQKSIVLTSSDDIIIEKNIVLGAEIYGISLHDTHHAIILSNNLTRNNVVIHLSESSEVTVKNNFIDGCLYAGVFIEDCNNILALNNTLINSKNGLFIFLSKDITILENSIKNNYVGLSLSACERMNINRNMFIDNQYAVSFSSGGDVYVTFGRENIFIFIRNTHALRTRDVFAGLFFLYIILLVTILFGCLTGLTYVIQVIENKSKSKNAD